MKNNVMVIKNTKIEACELIRHFAIGRMTNDEFEELYSTLEEVDEELKPIFHYGLWTLYNDNDEYALKGQWALTKNSRREVARIILFLRSDIKYRWPKKIAQLDSIHLTRTFLPYLGLLLSWLLFLSSQITTTELYTSLTTIFILTLLAVSTDWKNNQLIKVQEASLGDLSVWPFFSHKEYIHALNNPIYLANKMNF